jgi:2-C-methyl-D-erythritol 2,4-cyclodiphosphate synthase
MGVRFTTEVRRLIVAATTMAEARGHERPQVRDLADALVHIGETLPPLHIHALNDDLEEILGAAANAAGQGEVTVAMVVESFGAMHREPEPAWYAKPRADAGEQPVAVAASAAARVGIGYDSHRFALGGPMILGGVPIESDVHASGHSDGDAVCHALTDAILGAAAAGDIGSMFPDTDPANKGRNSIEMLTLAVAAVRLRGFVVSSADVTVVAERPKIGPHRDAMCVAIGRALDVDASMVSVKGKTNEGMGWIGRGEGLAVMAVATLTNAQH